MAGHRCTTDAHCALFYRDTREYLDGIAEFLEGAREAGDPVAAAVPAAKLPELTELLTGLGVRYQLLDMGELGRNPARIIPAVRDILVRHPGSTVHFVGELVWPGRSRAELGEATRHEALINLAWREAPVRVLCPYDEVGLAPEVLSAAEATHPTVIRRRRREPSAAYRRAAGPLLGEELEPPPGAVFERRFGRSDLGLLRRAVRERARRRGLPCSRAADLTLAVDELATNTIRHAEGRGRLRVWDEPGRIVCEVEDLGHISDPMAGRRRPDMPAEGGIGLWAVNQLCDLVQMRSAPGRTVVRVHMNVG